MTKAALSALITTPLYLALMVWLEGGWSATLAKPAVVAVLALTVLAGVVSVFSRANVSKGERDDRADRWVLLALIVISLAGGLLPAWTDGRGLWPIGGGEALRWAGVAIYAIGGVLRLVPVFVLGHRFSGRVAIQPGHTLETTGIYGLIRNPSYLGFVLLTLGWALAFDAWIGVLCTLLMIPFLIARMNAEERMLASQFGEAFAAWRARTWRLIPWVY